MITHVQEWIRHRIAKEGVQSIHNNLDRDRLVEMAKYYHQIGESGKAYLDNELRTDKPQCKDIPTLPILQFLKNLNGKWGTCFPNWTNSVQEAMPKGAPEKLVQAKMRNLILKGYVDGCYCGCRGDYELTDKGLKYLEQNQ